MAAKIAHVTQGSSVSNDIASISTLIDDVATASGDVCIVTTSQSPNQGETPPAGWTLIASSFPPDSNRPFIRTYYRVLDGSERGTGTFSTSNGATTDYVLQQAVYRNVVVASPIDASGTAGAAIAASVQPAQVTTTRPHDAILLCYAQQHTNATFTPPAGFTQVIQRASGGGGDATIGLAHLLHFASIGSTSIGQITSNFSARWGTVTIALTAQNDPPSAPGAFTSPTSGAVVNTTATVAAGAATDPDGDALTYEWDLSLNNGATWTRKRNRVAGTSWTYDYTNEAATTAAKWRVRAHDGMAYGAYTESPVFEVRHNQAPFAPVLDAPPNGSTINLGAANRFRWTPQDPDAGDSQTDFDLRYRVEGGAWVLVSPATGSVNAYHDFPAGTFTAGNYEWQVRTYDSQGVVGPYSASDFFTAASAPPAPSVEYPLNGATISTESDVLKWITGSQTGFQVRKMADDGVGNATTTVLYDSGEVASTTARTHGLTFPVNGRAEHLQVRIKRDGLWSAWASVRVVVDYTVPAVPVVTVTPDAPVVGAVLVEVANPPPAGTQPTVSHLSVYRTADVNSAERKRLAVEVPASGPWVNYTAASGQDYAYMVVAHGSNGTSVESEWAS